MRISRLAPAAVALVAAPLAFAPASAGAATPTVKFSTWQADYRGSAEADTPVTAAKLNGEYITITNATSSSRSIGGYTVRDSGSKHIYTIPRGFTLGPKKSVVLHSGKGTNSSTNLYWGQSVSGAKPVSRNNYVWNNDKETATLRTASGATVFTCSYKKTSSGRKAC